jgi:hypothetical protein
MGNNFDRNRICILNDHGEPYKSYLVYYYEEIFCGGNRASNDDKFEMVKEIVVNNTDL